jgi:hypothetical protein
MDRKQTIHYYIQRLSDKNFQIYDVRRELEHQKVPEEEIKIIVRAVDDELQNRLLNKNQSDSTTNFIRIGIILMVIGVVITVASLARVIDTGGKFVLAYGPFIGGLSIILVGLIKRKKKRAENSSLDQTKSPVGKREISFRKRRE